MAVRFDPEYHIVRLGGDVIGLVSDGAGGEFTDIHGQSGATAMMANGDTVGVDLLEMAAGSAFEIHTHPGAHILVIREGRGDIKVDGVSYGLRDGDTVFVPAEYPHGVRAAPDRGMSFLAFGVPHLPIWSPARMTLIQPADAESGQGIE